MPIDLHQRLSEYSYGFGVTREVEKALSELGLQVTPYLPNLREEARFGADVAFDRPGVPILLQFKLGHALMRLHHPPGPRRDFRWLSRPFWRFEIDTAELGGQFDLLAKHERDGAEVYYVAPRITKWDDYSQAFHEETIVEHSILVRPSTIEQELISSGQAHGKHRVLYCQNSLYICSDPRPIEEVPGKRIAGMVKEKISQNRTPIREQLGKLFVGVERERDLTVKRSPDDDVATVKENSSTSSDVDSDLPARRGEWLKERQSRYDSLRQRLRSEEKAMLAIVGFEAWAVGAQLIFATEADPAP